MEFKNSVFQSECGIDMGMKKSKKHFFSSGCAFSSNENASDIAGGDAE